MSILSLTRGGFCSQSQMAFLRLAEMRKQYLSFLERNGASRKLLKNLNGIFHLAQKISTPKAKPEIKVKSNSVFHPQFSIPKIRHRLCHLLTCHRIHQVGIFIAIRCVALFQFIMTFLQVVPIPLSLQTPIYRVVLSHSVLLRLGVRFSELMQ